MKKLVAFLSIAFTLPCFATQINWGTWGMGSTFDNGTAYLVQATTSGSGIVDTSAIKSALDSAESLPTTTPSAYEALGNGVVSHLYGLDYGAVGLIVPEPAIKNTDYFVIVISSDKKSYAISNVINSLEAPSAEGLWTQDFGAPNSTEGWYTTSGKVGSAVPEPTVLALLALGVAGVALRRKKVVA